LTSVLKDTDLSFNQITQIPEVIAQLSNRTELSLNRNQITAILDVIANLADLALQFQIFPDKFFLGKIFVSYEQTAI